MYLLEWMLWHTQTSKLESQDWQKKLNKHLSAHRAGKHKHEESLPGIHDRASDYPCADGSLHEFNETYIDIIAGGSQSRRGIITYITLMTTYFLYLVTNTTILFNESWLTGKYFWSNKPATTDDYVAGLIVASLAATCYYVTLRYVRIFINLENFVQRRLLIRFNRVTRQVYLHRPKFAGGITVLDWEQVTHDSVVGQAESTNAGRQLVLLWDPAITGLPHLHLMFVGKTADGTSDIVNLWEFIRRYMEQGPQSVPAPKKLLGKVPWPWQSVMASLSFFRPLWRAGLRWQVAFWVALASPALALHAVGHWISLLLCWEPRWPRIIREAGLPGKPIPPLSTAADWPPLPQVDPPAQKPRPARKPKAAPAPSELGSSPAPDTQRQEPK
ncbi:hypothetical protein P0Y43_00710 [Pseudomonas entomophila]|uniref:DUF6708 domain-containing protein n=1 Tax=Pseudomonas entomophila TaxID=312306 RepID=UPI0023D8865C|nr:DUF6708 domain-containing protein [Pseudomonas entomophila]MDF0729246.1 hypothetical protein [Pseudomonas entomophila]